jgi:putative redox protein
MARAKATIGEIDYAVAITARQHQMHADEGQKLGGQDTGPAPYELLLASLGACTSITLRMYAKRKGWDLKRCEVDLHYEGGGDRGKIERILTLSGELSDEQKARLADIAERTPVTLTLKAGADIHTQLAADAEKAHLDEELDEALDESFPASDPASITRPRGLPD